jgi:hypothetical protein
MAPITSQWPHADIRLAGGGCTYKRYKLLNALQAGGSGPEILLWESTLQVHGTGTLDKPNKSQMVRLCKKLPEQLGCTSVYMPLPRVCIWSLTDQGTERVLH